MKTTDVWFIAFLMHKKVPIHDYRKKDYGRVECEFNLTEEEWKKYKIEFDNSDIIQFKSYIQRIKDLSF